MLKAGSKAPDFKLPDSDDNEVTLSQLLKNGPLILYFYPADFTPGCTKEACSIRDIHDDITSVGLQVVGVSPQDAESHRKFRDQHSLPFLLLCDPEKEVVKAYDVDGPLGFGVRRVTYLITQDQKIEDAVQADIRIDKHNDFIDNAILLQRSAAKTNRVKSGQVAGT
ncbi:MAG: peroxiredoxin [Woeseiaceae bacterium]|nr:peroxiredoxin [Woeseiaceae bacterium]